MSSLKKIYNLTQLERIEKLEKKNKISIDEAKELANKHSTVNNHEKYDPIENFIGYSHVPLGIVPSIIINGKNYVVPIATEELTVIAGIAKAAKLAKPQGGFTVTHAQEHVQGGEVVLEKFYDLKSVARYLEKNSYNVLRGEIEIRAKQEEWPFVRRKFKLLSLSTELCQQRWFVINFKMTCGNAMGAHIISDTAERIGRFLQEKIGGQTLLAIITNSNCDSYHACGRWHIEDIGLETAEKIVSANKYASFSSDRATTQMKGAMNAIDGILLASGNDWRAAEAANHHYLASNEGSIKYKIDYDNKVICGTGVFYIPCGIIGGATNSPMPKIVKKILGIQGVLELGSIAAAAGLAANFAALLTLVTTGITVPFTRAKLKYTSE